jgi:hypothetical protein
MKFKIFIGTKNLFNPLYKAKAETRIVMNLGFLEP